MKNIRQYIGELSPMKVSAILSLAALVCVVGYQIEQSLTPHSTAGEMVATDATPTGQNDSSDDTAYAASTTDTAGTSTLTDIDHLSSNVVGELATQYMIMQQTGTYTPDAAAQVASEVATNVHPVVNYVSYTADNIKTDPDTSYTRMIKYRADLRVTLAPLLKNTTPEINIVAMYTQTKDAKYLTQLKTIAQSYRDVASTTAKVVVPIDAVSYQLGILNAMQEFAATLDSIAAHADDPIASAALLISYNQAEQDMFTSFNSLSTFYTTKHA